MLEKKLKEIRKMEFNFFFCYNYVGEFYEQSFIRV